MRAPVGEPAPGQAAPSLPWVRVQGLEQADMKVQWEPLVRCEDRPRVRAVLLGAGMALSMAVVVSLALGLGDGFGLLVVAVLGLGMIVSST